MYITDQRIFAAESSVRKRSYAKCKERFIRKYSDSPMHIKSFVSRLIQKCRTIGSVLYKICYRKKTVLTYEKLEDCLTRLQLTPYDCHKRQVCVCVGSNFKAAKLIKFCPCRVGVVHEFKPTDAPQRSRFCNWMMKNMHDGLVNRNRLFINDEAYSYFHRIHEFGGKKFPTQFTRFRYMT
jgi:hypothetical protein